MVGFCLLVFWTFFEEEKKHVYLSHEIPLKCFRFGSVVKKRKAQNILPINIHDAHQQTLVGSFSISIKATCILHIP